MTDNIENKIKDDVKGIYDKIRTDTSRELKKCTGNFNSFEKKTKKFWKFAGIKEALFWSMCISVILLFAKAALTVYGVEVPVVVWQILYPCAIIPLAIFAYSEMKEKK